MSIEIMDICIAFCQMYKVLINIGQSIEFLSPFINSTAVNASASIETDIQIFQ